MDNIIFKKVWQDDNLIELEISASCEFASAYQSCYVEDKVLLEISNRIQKYIDNCNESCYLEFGKKGRKLYTGILYVHITCRYIWACASRSGYRNNSEKCHRRSGCGPAGTQI